MSGLLRHDTKGMEISSTGYVLVSDLLSKLGITIYELNTIVNDNNKQRFEYSEDGNFIKARQGHSNPLVTELELKEVPNDLSIEFVYHGTSDEYEDSILSNGLLPMKRQHVHWTMDYKLAEKRAKQKSDSLINMKIYALDVRLFLDDGNKLYVSNNNVYLTGQVDSKYFFYYNI